MHVIDKGLKKNAIGYLSNVVISTASVAPAYSIAATLGFIIADPGITTHAPAVMLASFVPMLLIAAGYRFLNRADPAGPDNDDAATVLREASELTFLDTPIVARKAFGKAAAQGLAVTELKPPDEKAIQEMQALVGAVFQHHRTTKRSGHAR